MTTEKHIEVLARAAFRAHERVRMLGMLNTPDKYEDREMAFVELAKAREAAAITQRLLDHRLLKD